MSRIDIEVYNEAGGFTIASAGLCGRDLVGVIPGVVPSLVGEIRGCSFRDRCKHAQPACAEAPPLRQRPDGHSWRCILEDAA